MIETKNDTDEIKEPDRTDKFCVALVEGLWLYDNVYDINKECDMISRKQQDFDKFCVSLVDVLKLHQDVCGRNE